METFQLPKRAADILKKHAAAAFATGDPYQYLLSVGLGDALTEAGYDPQEAFEKVIRPLIEAFVRTMLMVEAGRTAGNNVRARMIIRFEADSYPYEKLSDFYAWEAAIRKGTARARIDVEAVQRLGAALNEYEESLQKLASHLNRNVFANDIKIIRSVRDTLTRPVKQGWHAINAFLYSENSAFTGGIRKHLAEREILDPKIQEMLGHSFDVYSRISHLLVWREALAIPPQFAALPQASFFVENMDVAEEIRSQMKSITPHVSLLSIKGELILPVALQNYLGYAFLEVLKNSLCATQESSRSLDIVVELSHRGNDGIIAISDNAGGVQAEDFRRMFCIGYSLRGDGNGLGWSVISKTINRHGGSVEVENVPGVGIRTVITLPLRVDPQTGYGEGRRESPSLLRRWLQR